MKIAFVKDRTDKNGRRRFGFCDDSDFIHDRSAEELKSKRVPGVTLFEKNGDFVYWQAGLITFDPDNCSPSVIHLPDYLHPWIEAGIRLAASDFKMAPKRGYSAFFLSVGRCKPLYHMVWERWPIWQSDEHREKMKSYTVAAGAHEDLLAGFTEAMKGITPNQVKDACRRLGLPLLSR